MTTTEYIIITIISFLGGFFLGATLYYIYFLRETDQIEANNKIIRDGYREDLKDLRDKLKKYERTNV